MVSKGLISSRAAAYGVPTTCYCDSHFKENWKSLLKILPLRSRGTYLLASRKYCSQKITMELCPFSKKKITMELDMKVSILDAKHICKRSKYMKHTWKRTDD